MTKIYVMESCPDCIEVKQLYKDNPDYELIDIGQQARSLKLKHYNASLAEKVSQDYSPGAACNLDGTGC